MNTPRTALEQLDRIADEMDAAVDEVSISAAHSHLQNQCDTWASRIRIHRKALSEALDAEVVFYRARVIPGITSWIEITADEYAEFAAHDNWETQRLVLHPDDRTPPPTSAKAAICSSCGGSCVETDGSGRRIPRELCGSCNGTGVEK